MEHVDSSSYIGKPPKLLMLIRKKHALGDSEINLGKNYNCFLYGIMSANWEATI